MKSLFYQVTGGLGIALLLAFAFLAMPKYPTVFISHSTGKCVEIRMPDGSQFPCDRLSEIEKYNRVWVK